MGRSRGGGRDGDADLWSHRNAATGDPPRRVTGICVPAIDASGFAAATPRPDGHGHDRAHARTPLIWNVRITAIVEALPCEGKRRGLHAFDLGDAPGRANAGDKLLTLVASALAGGECIDDAAALRAGGTASVLGCTVKAPSTLGVFLRSFSWGHVLQLDRLSRELLARSCLPAARRCGRERTSCVRSAERFSITIRHVDADPVLATCHRGAAVAETTYTPFQHKEDATAVRLIVRRVKPTPGSQLALFANYSYHAFITDRAGELLELEADHRRHAEIENAIP